MRRFNLAIAAVFIVLSGSSSGHAESFAHTRPVHIVRSGETLWSISQAYRVTPEAIAGANRLSDLDRLREGERLTIPAVDSGQREEVSRGSAPSRNGGRTVGGAHLVRSGETLWSIARQHRASVGVLVAINGLSDADRIRFGQTLIVDPARAVPGRRPAPPGEDGANRIGQPLAWPNRGAITSRFEFRGGRHHHGIDLAAPIGAPIFASLDGTVQFVGGRGSYGLLVILNHGNGLTTWYGHASRLLVTTGRRVSRGQVIAAVGTTGQVTGPNLHFEVRQDDIPQDPMAFLKFSR